MALAATGVPDGHSFRVLQRAVPAFALALRERTGDGGPDIAVGAVRGVPAARGVEVLYGGRGGMAAHSLGNIIPEPRHLGPPQGLYRPGSQRREDVVVEGGLEVPAGCGSAGF